MQREDILFHVSPKIVRAGETTRITIRPKFRQPDRRWRITARGMEGLGQAAPVEVESSRGAFAVSLFFPEEQEYVLRAEDMSSGEPRHQADFHLYALAPDLHALVPWKGDFHMHSTRSDGKEEPGYVAGACRRIGMDFMALTDHGQYEPSLEAMRAFQGAPVDLAILPGEEVHPPGVHTHILHLGGSSSVNALFQTDAYRQEVARRAAALTGVPAAEREVYAACEWCFERIRSFGGVGILTHPYWVFENAYNVHEPLLRLFMERIPFDALEIIGGYTFEEAEANSLQVARWREECARGRRIPVVGVSDARGCETGKLFGWYWSVVFSPSRDIAELGAAMRGMLSVAVEAMPGMPPRVHGPFRLAKLVHYLIREIFPLHDELAFEEGKLMLAMLAGDAEARGVLQSYQGRTARLYDRLWGRGLNGSRGPSAPSRP